MSTTFVHPMFSRWPLVMNFDTTGTPYVERGDTAVPSSVKKQFFVLITQHTTYKIHIPEIYYSGQVRTGTPTLEYILLASCPSLFPPFQCYTQKRGKVWSIWWCHMDVVWADLVVVWTSWLPRACCPRMHARVHNRIDLPCQRFWGWPELNRRHCQKMNEDASGSRRRPLLAMLDFYFG